MSPFFDKEPCLILVVGPVEFAQVGFLQADPGVVEVSVE